ncbi:MAG TPA: helix-turn-helix domain-containing protein [Candidatus Paceibacterota bacterium]|nr:helix-turn-helix domain-containing protein [Candidatus Paceibacterota bacterium]
MKKTIDVLIGEEKIVRLILNILCNNEMVDIIDVIGHPGKYGKKRTNKLVCVRQLFCYFARKYTNMSLREIGNIVNYDHCTVIHSLKVVNNEIEIYPMMKLKIERYSKIIEMEINFAKTEAEEFFLYYDFCR